MSNNNNPYISLDFSNKQLEEFPKELYNYKLSLNSLDISANPLINLDKAIEALKEFPALKKLKINIETGDEAKKVIDELPNLLILNDHPIHEEEEEENDNNENQNNNKEITNIKKNDNLIKQEIAQLNYSSIKVEKEKNINDNNNSKDDNIKDKDNTIENNSEINIISNNNNINNSNNISTNIFNHYKNNKIRNNNNNNISMEKNNTEIIDENNKFENILNKIKEYSEITKEQYELIITEYNNLMKNSIKNTLDICSFFNKILINLIKNAQEKNNIEISSIRPLLEAQSENEIIRIKFEEKMNIALQNSNISTTTNNNINYNTNNNNHSYITIDSLRDKKKLIKTETNSNSQEKRINLNSNNFNSNINNNNSINYTSHSNYKKRYEKNSSQSSNKILNKNELRKQYSNNIKNLSLSKIKKKDTKDTNTDNDRNNNNNNNNNNSGGGKNITFSLEDYLSDKHLLKNKSFNNFEIIQKNNKNEKKRFKFIQKTHSKKKINNKISTQQDNIDTYSNICTNINTDCNNKLNISQPNVIKLNNTNNSSPLVQTGENYSNHQYKNRIDYKSYNYMKKNYGSDNNMKYLGKTISTISNDNYLSKYDLLRNCQDNPTINSLLFQFENNNEGNFEMSKIFDGLKDIVYYDYNNIHTINLKNLLEIINQIYKIRANRIKKQMTGSYTKGTLETDLMAYLKSKYGLKKLIIEWNINILSSIKAFSKINGEVCLFGLILKNELDEGSIDILFKIKETVDGILKPLYKYENETINNIKNNKEFMKENEWSMIAEILYNNDNNLRQKFQNKVYMFIKKFINNDIILEKNGKKILFSDFLNQLIMFNLRLRKRYLNNLVNLFKKQDKERYGFVNYNEFRLIIEETGIFEKDKLKEVTDYLIESADKEGSGQITFNDTVICFDNFYLDSKNNNNEDKIKLLDKINSLKLNIN